MQAPELRTYKRAEPRAPLDLERRTIVTKAHRNELSHLKFRVKCPANTHMHTVAYLKRSFHVVYGVKEYANGPLVARNYSPKDVLFGYNSPGFSLQNNIAEANIMYNTTHVTEYPSQWLSPYSQLYAKSLLPYVRHSGRSFCNPRTNTFIKYGPRPDEDGHPAIDQARTDRIISPELFNRDITRHPYLPHDFVLRRYRGPFELEQEDDEAESLFVDVSELMISSLLHRKGARIRFRTAERDRNNIHAHASARAPTD